MTANQDVPEAAAQTSSPEHYWHVPRLLLAWTLTVVAAAGVALLTHSGGSRMEWLTVVLAFGTLLTFILQLGTAQRQGFIARTALSVGGVVVLVAVVAAVAILLG